MEQVYHCYFCALETSELPAQCPQCNQPFLTPRQIRRRGWLLTILGGLLAFPMGWLAIVLGRMMYFPTPDATTRFDGGPMDKVLVLSIFYLVISFGLVCMAAGIWQIRTGRKPRKLVSFIGFIALLLFVIGTFITTFLG